LIGGKDLNYEDEVVKYYDIASNSWYKGASLPKTIYQPKSVVIGDYIYILGGRDDANNILKDVYRYDTINDTIDILDGLNDERIYAAACSFKGNIYVFGGLDHKLEALDTAEFYDSIKEDWKNIEEMPFAWYGGSCVNINDEYILLFGGMDNSGYLNKVVKYYPDTGKYEVLDNSILVNAFKRSSVAGAHVVDYNGYVYYFGGYNPYIAGTATAERMSVDAIEEEPVVTSSGGGGGSPLFDVFSLLVLLGGALLIFKRK